MQKIAIQMRIEERNEARRGLLATDGVDDLSKQFIADAVHEVVSQAFPSKYVNLCHAYAVVGSNLVSVALGRNYRPTAGLAILDAGNGHFLGLIDNAAFNSPIGGNYHCWICSGDRRSDDAELIDFTFRNNRAYAEAHGIEWARNDRDFLWGREAHINVGGPPFPTPKSYGDGRGWFCETKEGNAWMANHIAKNSAAYVSLTSLALRYLNLLSQEHGVAAV